MWVNNQRWYLNPFPFPEVTLFCSGHVKAFTIVTKRPYHPGTCNNCIINAYLGLISKGGNEKNKQENNNFWFIDLYLTRKYPPYGQYNHDFFRLVNKIRASRYPIAISLMINSSSIFSTPIFRLVILLMKRNTRAQRYLCHHTLRAI